ncbi:hypothetical protein FVEN_g2073 [Fusarium venenatum]|uniref:Hypersensitive response-inducing protein n=1 Tax=Fusarium venenatum TaxID=56646 RepID=A0A2L2TE13_9HYPO|nr:uncharacterized protein FVRRES_12483 [Fusarium venenatum]KAG8360441.1 hypothetical protein FVEN_g2073 [Fusarium venenatum]KAH6979097.1 hypothetical protein EDB82DRAFT_477816 [Fusarium venenatum]CEI39792.1 unnamed protein product [Fusarium venenatum]
MKFSAAALLTAAASVSATSNFEVQDFTASCVPHSTFCNYSFKVIQPNSMETWKNAVECSARAQSTDYSLPDIKDAKCKDSSRTFSITRMGKGLGVMISQPVSPKSNTVGDYLIPMDQLIQKNENNAQVEAYNGPTSFELTQRN